MGNRPSLCNPRLAALELLEFDGAAGSFDLLLDFFGFRLGNAFLDSLRSAFDQRLGFAEAQTGDGADFLDDVDLVATVAGQDDVTQSASLAA